MAIIEFINRKNETMEGMKKNIDYILADEKTENKKYTYGHNCDVMNAYDDFMITKMMFHKISGRQHIHFTQSFKGWEASPELAHEIAKKLLEHPIFKNYQVITATHLDTDNIHNHFVINTVSHVDGKKWKISKAELEEIKDLSDELCMEHGLSIVDKDYKTTKEYKPEWRKNPIQYDCYKALNEGLKKARDYKELEAMLSERNIKLYWDESKDFSKNKELEKILNACKYYAFHEQEFVEALKKYDVEISWNVVAVVSTEKEDGTKTKTDMSFENILEYKNYCEKIKGNSEIESYRDEIKYYYKGKEYTPASFVKNMRYEGKMLREQFQVNYLKDEKKTLPEKENLKDIGNSDEYKNLAQMIKVARQCSRSREEFIQKMSLLGVNVKWGDKRKYITFEITKTNSIGKKYEVKYRNRSFFPRSSFTKEAFEQVFSFNSKMHSLIKGYNIQSYQELQNLALSGLEKGLRLDEETRRVHLKMEFTVDKTLNKTAKKGVNDEVETEIVERESYFDQVAIERFLADEKRKDIVLPEKEEIIKQENRVVLLESEEGYLFSSTNLSKRLTKEKIEEIFYNNSFYYDRNTIFKDIQSILYCSYEYEDFSQKLKQKGYTVNHYTITGEEKKMILPTGAKKGDEILLFTQESKYRFASTRLWKHLTREYLEECFTRNREYQSRQELNDKFMLFNNMVWFLDTGDVEEVPKDVLMHRKLEGQALKDYLKEKGMEI